MECCQRSFYQNDKKRKELWKSLKLTQLKKITLMEQYQDIFDEFQDIVETESSLITHKEDNKQIHNALKLKSDELMLISDQIVDCIHEYQMIQQKTTQNNDQIQRYFDQKWLVLTHNLESWTRTTILSWLKYKMKWFKDNDKEQNRKESEIEYALMKYNISGKNLNKLSKYLGNIPHWKREIGQHIDALLDHHALFQKSNIP